MRKDESGRNFGAEGVELHESDSELSKNQENEPFTQMTSAQVAEAAKQIMPRVMRRLRKDRGRMVVDDIVSFSLPVSGQPGREAPLVALKTTGCMHSLGAGGCTMCEYGWAGRKVQTEELRGQLDRAFKIFEKANEEHEIVQFNINALGSFFDDREFPPEIRREIYERIKQAEASGRKVVFITESRLEYIDEAKLLEMRTMLGDEAKVEIGYGMESTNELIRDACVNKLLPADFEKKLALLKQFSVERWAHIILKPPFLNERDGIEDAVKSIDESFNNDWAEHVILMSMNIRKSTLVGELVERHEYELPDIWSLIEVVKRVGSEKASKLSLLGFVTANGTEQKVTGCSECEAPLKKVISKWTGVKEDYDELMRIEKEVHCACRGDWQKEVDKKPSEPLHIRIAKNLDRLTRDYLGAPLHEAIKSRPKIV